ncbi:hypothetical protein EJP02_078 [Escherichia phage EJP2]|nr:hypothetical protein EJP02_078 [Escherichia phage EJP2]
MKAKDLFDMVHSNRKHQLNINRSFKFGHMDVTYIKSFGSDLFLVELAQAGKSKRVCEIIYCPLEEENDTYVPVKVFDTKVKLSKTEIEFGFPVDEKLKDTIRFVPTDFKTPAFDIDFSTEESASQAMFIHDFDPKNCEYLMAATRALQEVYHQPGYGYMIISSTSPALLCDVLGIEVQVGVYNA